MPVVVEREPRQEPDEQKVLRVAKVMAAFPRAVSPWADLTLQTRDYWKRCARAAIGALEGEGAITRVGWFWSANTTGVPNVAAVAGSYGCVSCGGYEIPASEFREFCEAGIALANQQERAT